MTDLKPQSWVEVGRWAVSTDVHLDVPITEGVLLRSTCDT